MAMESNSGFPFGNTGSSLRNEDGKEELPSAERIREKLQQLCFGLCTKVDPSRVAQSIRKGMSAGMSTSEFNELAAQTCAYMATAHPDYSKLAARIAVDYLHKNTESDFFKVIETLYLYKVMKNIYVESHVRPGVKTFLPADQLGRDCALTTDAIYSFVKENQAAINLALDYSRDFNYDYFGYKTLERSYLLRVHGKIVERPQHLLMRVACGIHCGDLSRTVETYTLMSQKYFTHASPTLFNSGTCHPQMSSCFLLTMQEDSIDGIFSTLRQCALISKRAGGVGLNVSDIRATNSYIRGTNGYANGLLPMLRIFNDAARYVDQGGGKRRGSMAIYLEPWHFDIFDFLDMRKSHGKEERRARDLFGALWIPDLFMERVQNNAGWTLMCPNECPGLTEVWGDDFKALYEKYEMEGRGRKTIPAQYLWFAILQAQIETGTPYMMYKDACNKKSNQKNLGTIKCGNLCTEVVEFTGRDEVAVCNLASVSLPKFVEPGRKSFNYEKLKSVVKVMTRNLNRIIDRNHYPIPEARKSNMRHRPIGIGVQGLADAFMLMRYPFDSVDAKVLNKNIFECIYYAALEASCELAATEGPYETYEGSPASEGILQFDMWGVKPDSGLCDWDGLKKKINVYGLRNSLVVSPMPTASTSQILGNNEAFEPFISNIYYRRVLSGEFPVVNPHLVRDLVERRLWTEETRQQLIAHNGSVQHLDAVPEDLKALYKTAWEIKQRVLLDLAVDRSPFIDQSQSLNIHMVNPTYAKLTSMHFYGWRRGLKTAGMLSDCAEQPSAEGGNADGDENCSPATDCHQTGGLLGAEFTSVRAFSSRFAVRSQSECQLTLQSTAASNSDTCFMCSG